MQMSRTVSWLCSSTQNTLTSLVSAILIQKSYLLEEKTNNIAQNI